MSTILNTTIKLRKDTAANFALVADSFTPLDGEVCIVDTGTTGIRLKVGNGVSKFGELSYIDTDSTFKSSVIVGYYNNGKFYSDSGFTKEITLYTHQIYIDNTTHYIYYYDNSQLKRTEVVIPTATASIAGIMKLYTSQGQNTDGTVTQKFFTDAMDAVELTVDPDDATCLVLSKPW